MTTAKKTPFLKLFFILLALAAIYAIVYDFAYFIPLSSGIYVLTFIIEAVSYICLFAFSIVCLKFKDNFNTFGAILLLLFLVFSIAWRVVDCIFIASAGGEIRARCVFEIVFYLVAIVLLLLKGKISFKVSAMAYTVLFVVLFFWQMLNCLGTNLVYNTGRYSYKEYIVFRYEIWNFFYAIGQMCITAFGAGAVLWLMSEDPIPADNVLNRVASITRKVALGFACVGLLHMLLSVILWEVAPVSTGFMVPITFIFGVCFCPTLLTQQPLPKTNTTSKTSGVPTDTVPAGTYTEGYLSMVPHILLLLFTCGIWLGVWIYRTTKFLNRAPNKQQDTPVVCLLLWLFVPFYFIYWTYKQAKKIDDMAKSAGVASNVITTCVLLSIFSPIFMPIAMQAKINEIACPLSGYVAGYVGIIKHTLLMVFTFGIWWLVWIYKTTRFLNLTKGRKTLEAISKLCLCMFIPMYYLYWIYVQAEKIDDMAKSVGLHSDVTMPSIFFSITYILPPIIMQAKINEIATLAATPVATEISTPVIPVVPVSPVVPVPADPTEENSAAPEEEITAVEVLPYEYGKAEGTVEND